jgi:hypothetical protein
MILDFHRPWLSIHLADSIARKLGIDRTLHRAVARALSAVPALVDPFVPCAERVTAYRGLTRRRLRRELRERGYAGD